MWRSVHGGSPLCVLEEKSCLRIGFANEFKSVTASVVVVKARGKTVTAADLHGLIRALEIPQADKDRLLAMTPGSYVGKAAELARRV